VFAAIFGLLVALPALRLRADYLAIAILAFGEILRYVVRAQNIGGWRGMVHIAPVFPWTGSLLAYRLENIGLVCICFFACFIVAQLLANSPYGRAIRAIREDEVAAESLGKDRAKYKAQILMLGSAMAGVAGGLYAQYLQCITPGMFMPMITFTVWIMVILGGPANNWGALLGAGLVELFDRGANIAKDYLTLPIDPSNLQYILFGVLILLILFFRPGGILKESPIKTKALRLARNAKSLAQNKGN
jgi:branched-chain amino acid transport system permease protein